MCFKNDRSLKVFKSIWRFFRDQCIIESFLKWHNGFWCGKSMRKTLTYLHITYLFWKKCDECDLEYFVLPQKNQIRKLSNIKLWQPYNAFRYIKPFLCLYTNEEHKILTTATDLHVLRNHNANCTLIWTKLKLVLMIGAPDLIERYCRQL